MIFQQGFDAYEDGFSILQNPYEYDTDCYISWQAGWTYAYELNQEDQQYE